MIELESQTLAWRAQSVEGNNMFPGVGGEVTEPFKLYRIDYHEGLTAIIFRNGRMTWNRYSGAPLIILIDMCAGHAIQLWPGDDSTGGGAGGIYGEKNRHTFNFLPMAYRTPNGGLGDQVVAREMANNNPYSTTTPTSATMPWRCYDGDPRGTAIWREGEYVYWATCSTGGCWVIKHRPGWEAGGYPYNANAAHVTTHTIEVIAVSIAKDSGNMFWLSAAGTLYYATKATWQAMDQSTPSATHYQHGFTHDASASFGGTLSQDSQKHLKVRNTEVYIAADEGVYKSTAGGAFSLLYGVSGSGATYEVLPTGTTSVDAVSVADNYLAATCYNSATQNTLLVVINFFSNSVDATQNITDRLGGAGRRATAMDMGYY